MKILIFAHVLISLIGILSGFVVLFGLLSGKGLDGWTVLFLTTTVATSITGFFFPVHLFMPSHAAGILSLVVLAIAIHARYARKLYGVWRKTYAMGTDATRSSFNPWLGLYFLVTGKVASGAQLLSAENRLSREEALRLYTAGSAWFSQEETEKGHIKVGEFADFALLSKDYMTVPEEQIKTVESVLTVVGGKPVYSDRGYKNLISENVPEAIPSWSPVNLFPSFHAAH